MISQETIATARHAADELRQRGDRDRAQAIDALIDAVRDTPVSSEAGGISDAASNATKERSLDLSGLNGQALKKLVQEGGYTSYRVGKLPILRETVEEYIRRAGPSLDLEEVSDEEAAQLVAEDRGLA